MDSIGGMLNPIVKMPKTHYKKFYLKLMVHNGILMETIGISVIVSIGLLLFFFSRGESHLRWRNTCESTSQSTYGRWNAPWECLGCLCTALPGKPLFFTAPKAAPSGKE